MLFASAPASPSNAVAVEVLACIINSQANLFPPDCARWLQGKPAGVRGDSVHDMHAMQCPPTRSRHLELTDCAVLMFPLAGSNRWAARLAPQGPSATSAHLAKGVLPHAAHAAATPPTGLPAAAAAKGPGPTAPPTAQLLHLQHRSVPSALRASQTAGLNFPGLLRTGGGGVTAAGVQVGSKSSSSKSSGAASAAQQDGAAAAAAASTPSSLVRNSNVSMVRSSITSRASGGPLMLNLLRQQQPMMARTAPAAAAPAAAASAANALAGSASAPGLHKLSSSAGGAGSARGVAAQVAAAGSAARENGPEPPAKRQRLQRVHDEAGAGAPQQLPSPEPQPAAAGHAAAAEAPPAPAQLPEDGELEFAAPPAAASPAKIGYTMIITPEGTWWCLLVASLLVAYTPALVQFHVDILKAQTALNSCDASMMCLSAVKDEGTHVG